VHDDDDEDDDEDDEGDDGVCTCTRSHASPPAACRWQLWLQRLQQDLAMGRPYDREAWRQQCLDLTYTWIGDPSTTAAVPMQPAGDALALAQQLWQVYGWPVVQQQRAADEQRAAELAGHLPAAATPVLQVAADS
jgi:hypothetical protein